MPENNVNSSKDGWVVAEPNLLMSTAVSQDGNSQPCINRLNQMIFVEDESQYEAERLEE